MMMLPASLWDTAHHTLVHLPSTTSAGSRSLRCCCSFGFGFRRRLCLGLCRSLFHDQDLREIFLGQLRRCFFQMAQSLLSCFDVFAVFLLLFDQICPRREERFQSARQVSSTWLRHCLRGRLCWTPKPENTHTFASLIFFFPCTISKPALRNLRVTFSHRLM